MWPSASTRPSTIARPAMPDTPKATAFTCLQRRWLDEDHERPQSHPLSEGGPHRKPRLCAAPVPHPELCAPNGVEQGLRGPKSRAKVPRGRSKANDGCRNMVSTGKNCSHRHPKSFLSQPDIESQRSPSDLEQLCIFRFLAVFCSSLLPATNNFGPVDLPFLFSSPNGPEGWVW